MGAILIFKYAEEAGVGIIAPCSVAKCRGSWIVVVGVGVGKCRGSWVVGR